MKQLDLFGFYESGTRIKFVKDLIAPACGDHPSLVYAYENDTGEIINDLAREGYWVKRDKCDALFGASIKEFIPIF